MVTAFVGENAVYIEQVANQETIQCAVWIFLFILVQEDSL